MYRTLLTSAAALALASPAVAQSMPGMDMPAAPHAHQTAPPAATPAPPPIPPKDMTAAHETAPVENSMGSMQMDQGAMPATDHGAMAGMEHHHAMKGAFGPYSGNREASGTAWQPDASRHVGLHIIAGNWTLMVHGGLSLVADTQGGPRGDDKVFVGGHIMAMARRELGPGTLQLRTILSPEPLMGARGYPLLLASGETADGVTRLVDRQHPHDFIGELSASYSVKLSDHNSVFLYAGLPGEPAFGPPAYLHREAIQDSPEAPITHHWLDSTHVTEGVITAGLVLNKVKFEASRFNGREPNQHRYDIETGPLDSTALRLSWNPTANLSLQTSWTKLKEPEQLEPGINQTRFTASALYARDFGPGHFAATLAWGRRRADGGPNLDAYAAEASYAWNDWTLFGRAERTKNNELIDGITANVGKVSVGAIRDFQFASHLKLGIGGLVARNFVPGILDPAYGGDQNGAMGFLRLKID
jgi:hypothetical protein